MLSYATTLLAVASLASAAPMYLNPVTRQSCDIAACGVALAPTGVGCVSAAVKLGADPFADAGCVAGVTNLGVNTPAACEPCFSAIGDLIPEPVKDVAEDVGDAIGDAFSDVKDGITGLFGRQEECTIAECGVALAPTGVSCVSAAVLAGANVFADIGCAVSVLNLGINTPAACRGCLDQLKAAVPEELQPVVEAASDVKETINEGIDTVVDEAKDFFGGLFDRQESCDIAACGIALGPTGVGCVAAAVELGANVFADAGCVAGVVNLGVNTPDVCKPCFSAVGDAVSDIIPDEVKDVAEDAGNAVGDAFDDVKDGISGLFN